ncbi:MAG: radical SAM protein [Candidatus Omnitrophica bacterium]|nr:radical SAM protein [Candidatus Omnitrophota bacterium]
MKILLINPEKLVHPPFGLLSIGSMLMSKGYDVTLVEMPFGVKDREREACFFRELERKAPDLIGFTCMTPQAPVVRHMVRSIKEKYRRKVPVVVGGMHPTVDPEHVLSWGADIAVRGEGEMTALDLMRHYAGELTDLGAIPGIAFRKDGKTVLTEMRPLIPDLNTLPPTDYSLLAHSRFKRRCYSIRGFWLRNAWIMTARGCPASCIFCATNAMYGKRVREFKTERLLGEIEYLRKRFGIEGFWVVDDNFSLKERRVVEFCNGVIARKIGLPWACQMRVDSFTEGMARAMKQAGCVQVDFGVESGSVKTLTYLKKDITPDDTRRAFRIAKAHGLRVLGTMLIGVPFEEEKDINETFALLDEISPNFVAPFFITPYPGTELYATARERGWLDEKEAIDWQSTDHFIMKTGASPEYLRQVYNRALAYNKSTIVSYLTNPRFLGDMIKLFVRHPVSILAMAWYLVTGRQKESMNVFLRVFRMSY